jgi:hypothetical protein
MKIVADEAHHLGHLLMPLPQKKNNSKSIEMEEE